jgi:hypothetical protein
MDRIYKKYFKDPELYSRAMELLARFEVVEQKWLRLFGQNIAFLKCSLAVYCLRCFWQHGQVVAVELIRCLVVKRRMRPKLVVEREILL